MNRKIIRYTSAVLSLAVCGAAFAAHGAVRKPKALVVMLDGMRADAVENALVPNLQMLRDGKWQPGYKCAWTLTASTIRDAVTVSAPNHVSIATGVTAEKTNVRDNGQITRCDFAKWPGWLVRVVDAHPEKKALFMYEWRQDEQIDPDPRVEFICAADSANAETIAKRLSEPDCPDAVMWFINRPDSGGHGSCYYPYGFLYLQYVHFSDTWIGGALRAIASRATFAEEDWMIIVVSDHGGLGCEHGPMSGHCWTVPLLITGRNVAQGRIPGMTHDYDVASTALAHFGLDVSAMKLDGKVRGREVARERVRDLKDGIVAYLPFDGKDVANRIAGGPKAVPRGATETVYARGGFLLDFLRVAADTNGVAGVELQGSEKLRFENGADFAMTLWVRMAERPAGDPVIAANKDWGKGCNPGIALVGSMKISTFGITGASVNGALADSRKRFDLGPYYDIRPGEWVFYAVTRGEDGVVRFYQGGRDGYLYSMAEEASALKLETGLPFYVGQDGTGRYPKTLKADIDEFALWTRGLTHEDVRRIYESGRKGAALGELLK